MRERRSILLNGLRLTLSRPGALLWTYAFNLGLALLFSLHLHAQLANLLDHSLASQRLTTGFDLGTLIPALQHLSRHTPAAGPASYANIPLYFIIYFILVPGTLFSYVTGAPARLSILAGEGLAFFWRFVRITLLAAVAYAIVLIPLALAQGAWSRWLLLNHTGAEIYYLRIPGILLIALIACMLRLYFDLVEVYTVQRGTSQLGTAQLSQRTIAPGYIQKPDRRVLRTLKPALRTLRRNFGRAYLSFVVLAIAGLAAMLLLTRVAVHMLAQARAWPMFLLAQLGLFLMLFTRFWQRGAETILAQDDSLPLPVTFEPVPVAATEPTSDVLDAPATKSSSRIVRIVEPPTEPTYNQIRDPLPNPEPMTPSLSDPDPGVFEHDPRDRP